MESLGLKIRKALSRLNQIDNYLYTKPERDWNYDDLSLVKSFLRTARVEEYNTMEDLKKVQEFFSKPLEEVSAEYKPKYNPMASLGGGKGYHIDEAKEEESVNEGMGGQLDEKYFIEVSVRDARKAIDIFRDRYRKADIEMYGSNVYASNTISDIFDLYYDLTSQNIEILDYDIDESDFDDESDDLEEVTNEFSPLEYAKKVINGKMSIEKAMEESGFRFIELKSLIDKIQKGLVPSMNEEQYGRSKLQKRFEDAISKETFSKLKGKKVGYFGNTYKVIDSDEYIITLQDDDGDIKTVNLNQFIQKGIIPELKKRIQETIKLGEGMIEEELCAKGKAYRKRRLAAGEKSSAYLSGRAVKVCKGQMSGTKKK